MRNALIQAALEEIAAGHKLSLRAIARRAGVSPGAPYHHFADKDALYAAIASDGFEQLLQAQAPDLALEDPHARLLAMVQTYVRFAVNHPTHYQIMFSQSLERSDQSLQDAALGAFGNLCQAIAGLNPGLDEAQVRLKTTLAWSLSHGAAHIAIQGFAQKLSPDLDLDTLAREIAQQTVQLALP